MVRAPFAFLRIVLSCCLAVVCSALISGRIFPSVPLHAFGSSDDSGSAMTPGSGCA
jgi:hypothetical protein